MAESRHSSADGKLKQQQGQLFLRQQQQRLKEQNQILFQLHRRREEQMRILTSQLLLLEANLRQKQSRIDVLLNQRDGIIFDQNERIRILERDLAEAHRKLNSITVDENVKPEVVTTEEEATPNKEEIVSSSPPPLPKPDAKGLTRNLIRLLGRDDEESLEDSDSAVVIEDGDHLNTSPVNAQQIKVIRSISDVVACARANILVSRDPIQRIKSLPIPQDEEEEGDEASSSSEDSPFNQRGPKSFLRGSLERTPIHQPTVHRSLSSSIPRSHCINHRSVTRPRDVKSKRTTRMTTRPPPPTHLLSRTHSLEGSSYPDIRLSPFLPSSRV